MSHLIKKIILTLEKLLNFYKTLAKMILTLPFNKLTIFNKKLNT